MCYAGERAARPPCACRAPLFLNHIHIHIQIHIHSANRLQNLHLHNTVMQNIHLHTNTMQNLHLHKSIYNNNLHRVTILFDRYLLVTCAGCFSRFPLIFARFSSCCACVARVCVRACFLRRFACLCKKYFAFFASEVVCKLCICIIRRCKICICIHFY